MSDHEQPGTHTETIHLPAPTAWPLVLAFGFTLLCAGLVTNPAISVLGGVLMVFGVVGWFRQVLPHEVARRYSCCRRTISIETTRRQVEKIVIPEEDRAILPVETYPIISGIKGGLAGGIAMIPPALLYGLIAEHSIWYPVNLLGGAGVANWRNPSTADIAAFHWQGLIVASIIHLVTCVLVGPALRSHAAHAAAAAGTTRRSIAPVLWTGLLHSTMGIVNPVLDEHIAWGWFLISQVMFGIVAGLVVARDERIRTAQSLPFVMRMGIETPGLTHEHKEEDDRS